MKKHVLVTGGAGYIGSHVCLALSNAGYKPIVYDNLSRGHKWAVKWGPLEIGDISDKKTLIRVLNNYKPVAVVHLAALAYVGESVQNPSAYYSNNVSGTLNLLEVLIDFGNIPIIFSSSCATYGIPKKMYIDEGDEQRPINPYGESKLMVEKILRDYDNAYGLKSVTLRYFNVVGADPDCQIGECHEPETHLIPLALEAALNPKKKIYIFGDDYPTKDGTCIRDYLHVSDLADAHIGGLSYLIEKDGDTDFINLGTGKGFSVKEIIAIVEKITKKKINTEVVKRRSGDPPILITSLGRAEKKIGWIPNHNDIEIMIYHAWKWHNKIIEKRKIS
tara:strand:+ start:316 stop:1314 length:999 start_codon:yes stop_codon:yes gene_type:complete